MLAHRLVVIGSLSFVACGGGSSAPDAGSDAPEPPCTAGTPTTSQVAGDCRVEVCDGAGGVTTTPDDTDAGDDGDACTVDGCVDGERVVAPAAAGTVCGDDHVCGAGGTCDPISCHDQLADGDEADVDCGGGACEPCADGAACSAPADCASGDCDGGHCATVCGDHITQPGETCDDGGTAPNDGCSATCHIETADLVPETEVNDTQALANRLPAGANGFLASIVPTGDQDYFAFDVVVPGATATIEVTDGEGGCPVGFDSQLALFGPGGAQLDADDDGGVGTCSRLQEAGLPVGTYRARVNHAGNNATVAKYALEIAVPTPACGDGTAQAGEQCDDDNLTAGDGCSATCQIEAPFEIEPNNDAATATPLWPETTVWRGAIMPAGDHDYFTFTLAAPASVTLTTHDPGAPASCGFDTNLHLLDGVGTQLAADDDAGVGSCSRIDAANLAAGTYRVWVQRYGDSAAIAAYQLDLTIQ